MTNGEHLEKLRQGVDIWNKWRKVRPEIIPNLSKAVLKEADLTEASLRKTNLTGAKLTGAILTRADLTEANLTRAYLREADLTGAYLTRAELRRADLRRAKLGKAYLIGAKLVGANLTEGDLRGANLIGANLTGVDLTGANLTGADLTGANLTGADLTVANLTRADLLKAKLINAKLVEADLTGANLIGANLTEADLTAANLRGANITEVDFTGANLRKTNLNFAMLVHTNLTSTNLTDCRVYGISARDLNLEGSSQMNIVITPPDQPTITVDNLEVAQFIYLLLHNEKIRDVIDTITSKAVLILGRFTEERKAILDALRETLRQRNYLPILFDFYKPASRDLTETVSTLAHMSRFIIADITEPKSIPQELTAIVPNLAVPIQPLLLQGSSGEYSMFRDLRKYHWVLTTYEYSNLDSLLSSLEEMVISPAEAKAEELRNR